MTDSIIRAGIEINADVAGNERIEQLVQSIHHTSDETNELTEAAKKLGQEWQNAQRHTALIEQYKALKTTLADNRQEITQTEQTMRQLQAQMQNGGTAQQIKEYKQLQNQIQQLNEQRHRLLQNLRQTSQNMNQAGISTRNLAQHEQQLAQQSQHAEQKLNQLNQEAHKLQQLAQARATLGLDVDDRVRQEIQKLDNAFEQLRRDGNLTQAELARAAEIHAKRVRELEQSLHRVPPALNQIGQSKHQISPIADGIGKIGLKAAAAIGSVMSLKQGLTEVLNATQEYQALATRFAYAFDGAEKGAEQLAFVRQEANRLGLEITGAANGYAQLSAATKNLNITTEQTQSIFKGVAAATAAMGLSADDANGVFLALSQIAGKGKVSMEELRGQLGERLAPAMSIAAEAMGVTTAELEKMVENGLAAETFLPRFGAALEQAFSKDAASNAESLSGQINLLKNSYNEFLIQLGEGGVGQAATIVLKDIGKSLEWAKQKFDEFSQSENGQILSDTLSKFYDLIKEIGNTVVSVFGLVKDNIEDVIGGITGTKNEIDLVQAVLNGVNLTVSAMRDGVAAVGIAFNLFSGAVKQLLSNMADGLSHLTWGSWAEELKRFSADLRAESDKNYQQAQDAALNFESHTAKTLKAMMEQANQAEKVYDHTNQAIKESVDETAQAESKARELSQAYKDAQTAATGLGLNIRAAMNEPTPAIVEMHSNLDKLVAGFDDLREHGVDASLLLGQAIDNMINAAQTQSDINTITAKIKQLGAAGKLSADDMTQAFLALDTKILALAEKTDPVAQAFKNMGIQSREQIELQIRQAETALHAIEQSGRATEAALEQARKKVEELKNSLDPTASAFERLGIKTKAALKAAAEQQMHDFEKVKKSGQATQEDLQKAFESTANAMLASGDATQRAWVQSQAAAYHYTVTVDDSGKAALQAAAQTQQAAQQQIAAHQAVAQAASQAAQQQTAEQKAAEKTAKTVYRISEATYTAGQRVKGMMISVDTWASVLRHSDKLYKEINQTLKDTNASMQTGVGLGENLAKMEMYASEHAQTLGAHTLSKLRAAIADAKQKMAEFAEEAANARKEAEKSLLSAQGKTDELAKLEQQEKIDALMKKKTAAERMGNGKAASDYQAAIAAQQQAFAEQQRREAQQREAERAEQYRQEREKAEREAQQQREQMEREAQQRAERAAQQKALETPSTIAIDMDTNELMTLLQERDDKVANQAVKQLMQQLKTELARQR